MWDGEGSAFLGKRVLRLSIAQAIYEGTGRRTGFVGRESVFPLGLCDCALYEITKRVEARHRLCPSG